MDNLTPPLITLVRELRFGLRAGLSLNECLREAFARSHDETITHLNELWQMRTRGNLDPTQIKFKGHHARVLWDLLQRGDKGQPIDEPLGHLLVEIERIADADMERHISQLPFKALFPLLIFQFPAFVLLLIGPLFRELQKHLLVILLLTVGTGLRAETLTTKYSHLIARADSAAAVRTLRKKYQAVQIARRACRIQLIENYVPYACFEALHLDGTPANTQTQAHLDAQCERASAEFRGLDGGVDRELSPSCRTAVVRARELQQYKAADTEIGSNFE